MDLVKTLRKAEIRVVNYRLFLLQLFMRFCLFVILFTFFHAGVSRGFETLDSLDFSGSGPLFLSDKQIQEDLVQAERLLKDNYVRYPILEQKGVSWKSAFKNLEALLLPDINPVLTHHFQEQLIKTLEFTEDSNIQADLFLKKRHYVQRIEPKVAFYTGIRMAQQQKRFSVLPSLKHPNKIVNHWFIDCKTTMEVFFPILPERQTEKLFMLGQQANHQLQPLDCAFENDSGEKQEIMLPLIFPAAELNRQEMPVFEFKGGRTPYIRWYRDGNPEEIAVKQFHKLGRKLQNTPTLIIDVRGNANGSFAFIEKWLKEFTSNHWKNVIVRERQTIPILKGLLNRVQWNLHHSTARLLVGKDQLEQKLQQLKALIFHFRENEITEKWVETKFIFNGKKDAPRMNTRLIVLANQHCGNGCQFLSALTKQIPDGILIGTNTGPFPKNTSGPIFQLKHSRIMLSFSHRIHLNHQLEPVSPSGYLPDYWLFPPMGLPEILRFVSKSN